MQFYAASTHILLVEQLTTLVQTERHDGADECRGSDDGRPDIRLLNVVDKCLIGKSAGVVHFLHLALLRVAHVADVGHSGDDVHVELTIQSLLHNLHVEQAQKSAAETEAKGHGALGLEGQRCVVQLQLLQ